MLSSQTRWGLLSPRSDGLRSHLCLNCHTFPSLTPASYLLPLSHYGPLHQGTCHLRTVPLSPYMQMFAAKWFQQSPAQPVTPLLAVTTAVLSTEGTFGQRSALAFSWPVYFLWGSSSLAMHQGSVRPLLALASSSCVICEHHVYFRGDI